MPFQLRVEFTGLCTYLVHATPNAGRKPGDPVPNAQKVTVVLPECRKGKTYSMHEDGEMGRAHVGYLRFNLANLASLNTLPAGVIDQTPPYEGIYRFTRQELILGLPTLATPSIHAEPHVPEMGRLAPTLAPRPEIFDNALAGDYAVMRTTFTGGMLLGEDKDHWEFSNLFNTQTPAIYFGDFADRVIWTRDVPDANGLTLTLNSFAGPGSVTIPLVPVVINGVNTISLKIANLCSDNPLEWEDLDTGTSPPEDPDFKWLYRLMLPAAASDYGALLKGKTFPIPKHTGGDRGGQGCVGNSGFVPPT